MTKKNPASGKPAGQENISQSRRKALARLGLGAAIAYSAPVIVHLDRSAHAAQLPTPCPPGTRKKACRKGGSSSSK